MELKIQTGLNNPILRKKSEEFSDFAESKKIEKAMKKFLSEEENGVGFAAPQVGINKRIFIAEFEKGKVFTVVNPKIISSSKKTSISQEGCLSLPGVWADIERPSELRVEFFSVKGEKIILDLSGFAARVFQHEFDHLDGVLFLDRAEEFSIEKGVDLLALGIE